MKYLCFPWGKEKASELRDTVVTMLIPFQFLFRVNTTIFSPWGIPYCSWVLWQVSGTWSKNVRSLLTFLIPPGVLYCTSMVYHSIKATQSSQMPWKLLGVLQFEGQWSQLGRFHWLQLIWTKLPSCSKSCHLCLMFFKDLWDGEACWLAWNKLPAVWTITRTAIECL